MENGSVRGDVSGRPTRYLSFRTALFLMHRPTFDRSCNRPAPSHCPSSTPFGRLDHDARSGVEDTEMRILQTRKGGQCPSVEVMYVSGSRRPHLRLDSSRGLLHRDHTRRGETFEIWSICAVK